MKILIRSVSFFFLIIFLPCFSHAQQWAPCPQSSPGATCSSMSGEQVCGIVPNTNRAWYYCEPVFNSQSTGNIYYYNYDVVSNQCSPQPVRISACGNPCTCPPPPPPPTDKVKPDKKKTF